MDMELFSNYIVLYGTRYTVPVVMVMDHDGHHLDSIPTLEVVMCV